MTMTTCNRTLPLVNLQGDREHSPRIERELEVVLKSGGVYCFVAKRKPACGKVPSTVAGTGEEKGLMAIEG